MKKVDIHNVTNRMKTFRIPHQEVCVKAGRCYCRNGIARSIIVPSHDVARNMDEAFLMAPEVEKALEKKDIFIKDSKIQVVPGEDESKEDESEGTAVINAARSKSSTRGRGKRGRGKGGKKK